MIHHSGDYLYFKKVIEQLNIEDMLPEINNTHKYEGALNEEGPGNKVFSWTKQTMFILNLFNYICISFHCFSDALDGVINEEGAHCLMKSMVYKCLMRQNMFLEMITLMILGMFLIGTKLLA